MSWPCLCGRTVLLLLSIAVFIQLSPLSHSQQDPAKPSEGGDEKTSPAQTVDPLTRPSSPKEKKTKAKALKSGTDRSPYGKWLKEDVIWIITPEERAAFAQLSNDEEREHFVEQFWGRRDPTPDTEENEYKEEHYHRLIYANEHFAAGAPGWKTDRGRMYIMHGPPDEIESHPSGGPYDDPTQSAGARSIVAFPFELWRYRHLDDVGEDVMMEFVDSCMCGDYHMTLDPKEKNALAHTPMGQTPNNESIDQSKEFERLDLFVKANRPPAVKFIDLQEIVTHKLNMALVPFEVLTNFVKITDDTVLVPIILQVKNRDITFVDMSGVDRGTINIYGRFTTIGGHVVQTFEDTVKVEVPRDLLATAAANASVYGKTVPLLPGRYLLDLVVKDVNGDRIGTWRHRVEVPTFDEDQLSTSSLIVADKMERMPTKILGTGSFAIGEMYVRPRVPSAEGKPASFKRNEKLNFWLQAYHLAVDARTHRPSATVEYDITGAETGKPVVHSQQSADEMGNIGDQMTLQKTLTAANLGPGTYRFRIRITDSIAKQVVERSASFVVE